MILVDTGPLLALFDSAGEWHRHAVVALKKIDEPLVTTAPVLTEAFRLLTPDSAGARTLMKFIDQAGLSIWFFAADGIQRAFELMHKYADKKMDFADASIVVAAEKLRICKVFSIDRKDFSAYRIKRGHRVLAFDLIEA